MSFDEDGDGRIVGDVARGLPVADSAAERGEQGVVDTGVERFGNGGEQRLGDSRRHRVDLRRGGRDTVACTVERSPEVGGLLGRAVQPEVQLSVMAVGAVDEGRRPGPRGCGLRAQIDRAAVGLLRACGDEVFDDRAPRDGVHAEVMDHDDQAARAGGVRDERGADEPTGLRVEVGARLCERRGERVTERRSADGGVGGMGGDGGGRIESASGLEHPVAERVGVQRRRQHRVCGDDGVQQDGDLVDGDARRSPQHHRLREVREVGCGVGVFDHPRGADRQRKESTAAAERLVEGFESGAVGDCLGHRPDCAEFEDLPGRQVQPGRTGAGCELDRHDRVAAECEETLGDADPVEPQQTRDDRRERPLRVADRFDVSLLHAREVGRGQCLAVHLARRAQRHLVDDHPQRRLHVRHQFLCGVRLERWSVGVACDVRDEDVTAGGSGGDGDRRVQHARCCGEDRLDLTRLDALTTQFHLEVVAAEVFDLAVRVPHRLVAGAVQALTRFAERIGDEPLGRQFGTSCISARHVIATEIQLALHTDGNRLETGIEDVAGGVPRGHTDRHRRLALADVRDRRIDRGLSRPVLVEQLQVRPVREDCFGSGGAEGLATGVHVANTRHPVARTELSDHRREHRRDEDDRGDPVIDDVLLQCPWVAVLAGLHHDHPTAVEGQAEELEDGRVEGVVEDLQVHVRVLERIEVLVERQL
ncbi:hypothetical protein GM1_002_01490 [Gordonia malaquae NBRC 108250]|uniref:Uncharacterized protein n=1 Tax=Gordonia malaquae NBRC 108250 TaxID=1223542 RepID=M3T9S5_GORML|nr:hypothetical protein GM1_002_01490 [Gordonia malaquae NBRC 108250]